jgi:hypothetical protein
MANPLRPGSAADVQRRRAPVGGENAEHVKMPACLIFNRLLKVSFKPPVGNDRTQGKQPFSDLHVHFHGDARQPDSGSPQTRRRPWPPIRSSHACRLSSSPDTFGNKSGSSGMDCMKPATLHFRIDGAAATPNSARWSSRSQRDLRYQECRRPFQSLSALDKGFRHLRGNLSMMANRVLWREHRR